MRPRPTKLADVEAQALLLAVQHELDGYGPAIRRSYRAALVASRRWLEREVDRRGIPAAPIVWA